MTKYLVLSTQYSVFGQRAERASGGSRLSVSDCRRLRHSDAETELRVGPPQRAKRASGGRVPLRQQRVGGLAYGSGLPVFKWILRIRRIPPLVELSRTGPTPIQSTCPLPRSGGGGPQLLLRDGGGSQTKNQRRQGWCKRPPQSGSAGQLPRKRESTRESESSNPYCVAWSRLAALGGGTSHP